MGSDETQTDGIVSTIRRLGESIFAVVENRLALAVLELNVEKFRLVELLVWGGAFLILGLLAAILLTFTVIVVFWDTARLAVLVGFTICYLIGATGCFMALKSRLKNWPTPFSDTIGEIKKDRACFQTRKSKS